MGIYWLVPVPAAAAAYVKHTHYPAKPAGVLLLVPNVLGYIRLLLLFLGWAKASSQPWTALVLFSLNLVLDGADGAIARALNQVQIRGH